ncbi:H(+)/Cl(-) exchange transporter 7 isoform X2 [Ctenocephalides felis]|uniref:H(+)/Cl(-) exchange transporter 7 isoform X2 n=1 Tax=Ctenocephalides felis TaxID=7515 RepID=UPI000E6E2FD2|nr:H(+)/Cl(-) exchange transporter 7 isoform X2 [Ctenocephalides felis]
MEASLVDSCDTETLINEDNDNDVAEESADFITTFGDTINENISSDLEPNLITYSSIDPRSRGNLNERSPYSLSSEYESLDYDICENSIYIEEEKRRGSLYILRKDTARWFICLATGVLVALIAAVVDIVIEQLSEYKYTMLSKSVDKHFSNGTTYIPYLLWIAWNIIPVLIGSFLVAYIEPVAGGSGIPQVKCFLNGVKVPRLVRFKTMVVKVIGVITSVVGGLAGGKEGPMIHTGAIIAAGISQGKSIFFGRDLKIFRYFREDHEKRDFVSGGAAAGVAAAFGAPIGGVLFSLEEGASFWNQSLTWRTFFASVMSTFTLNVILSAYHGHPGDLSYSGLINLGQFEPFSYEFSELPIFLLMGSAGGLLGALWNHCNTRLTEFRKRYIIWCWAKVLEAVLVAAIMATVACLMIMLIKDCRPLGQDPTKFPVKLYCGDGEYSAVASLWFQTPEASVKSLFHDPPGSNTLLSLLIFVMFYFPLTIWTYGLSVSSGLFIPILLAGAAWGRLTAMFLQYTQINSTILHPGKYALIGAAALLGGAVRMTLSLSVILIESTGNISFALPIILTLIAAKWTGDFFNEGIYDIHIQLSGIPFLQWHSPPLSSSIFASVVMSQPVIYFKTKESVKRIVEVLKMTDHNGFPVVEYADNEVSTTKRLRGLILRAQLIVILHSKLFREPTNGRRNPVNTSKLFYDKYPRYPNIKDIVISEYDERYSIDLIPYMNPSPYTVHTTASLPRMFTLFRALGLRHLLIINDLNEVVGVVTRKDLARFRASRHCGVIIWHKVAISHYD